MICKVSELKTAAFQSQSLLSVLFRHEQAVYAQASQSAACMAARRRRRGRLCPAEFGRAAESKLTWKHFPAGANGFFRAPVLVSGPTEASLIDGGFSFSDGRALVDAIKATSKKLTAIYISQSDPDYYFRLKPLRDAFPNVKVIAASATLEAIKGSVEKKLAVWGPQLRENGPQTLSDVVLPEAFDGSSLTVDGETVENHRRGRPAQPSVSVGALTESRFRRRHDLLGCPRLDSRHTDCGVGCCLDREPRQGRCPQTSRRGSRPYDA